MNKSPDDFYIFKKQYSEILENFLDDEVDSEIYLNEGNKLGRLAIAKDIGILNVAAIHQDCLITYLEKLETNEHLKVYKKACIFLEEILALYQMIATPFREAINSMNQRALEFVGKIHALQDSLAETKLGVERFRKILEATPDAIIMIDLNGKIIFINVQTVKLFGYEEQELIGQKVEILIPEPYRSKHPEHRRNFFAEPRSRPMGSGMDLFGQRKNLEIFPIEISISPFETKDGMVGLASIRDVSDRKLAMIELQKSLKEKEALLREVYHRVKNNLQVVTSLLKLQAEATQEPSAQHVLLESSARIKSMALIHEMLYQSENLANIVMETYINKLLKYLFVIYAVDQNKINLTTNIDDILLNIDTAIPCGLIMSEIVSNALKHAFPENKSGEIKLSLKKQENNIVLVISDDGIGIPENIDIKNTSSLGMRLIHNLAKQLGGDIVLENGKGTTFKLVFVAS